MTGQSQRKTFIIGSTVKTKNLPDWRRKRMSNRARPSMRVKIEQDGNPIPNIQNDGEGKAQYKLHDKKSNL